MSEWLSKQPSTRKEAEDQFLALLTIDEGDATQFYGRFPHLIHEGVVEEFNFPAGTVEAAKRAIAETPKGRQARLDIGGLAVAS